MPTTFVPAKAPRDSNYFSVHTHSQYSVLDGTTAVPLLGHKAHILGHGALGLTDHGSMAGTVKLYKVCKELGLDPYPGFEGYLIDPLRDDWANPAKGAPKVGRYHFGMVALTEEGYKGLVKFISMCHTRPRFNRFARCTFADLMEFGKEYGEHVAFTTGCFFGLIQQSILYGENERAHRYLEAIERVFPHTFVEVQHHNICHDPDTEDGAAYTRTMLDDEMVRLLMDLAESHDLPVVAGQDSHYLDQAHKEAHALMKRMTYGGAEDEFPGDSFHFASADWVAEHYTQPQWDRIEDGFAELRDLHDVKITPLDKFVVHMPDINWDTQKYVHDVTEHALDKYIGERGLHDQEQVYYDRLDHELDTIDHIGMPTYFAIVEDYVQRCRQEHIAVEARGSANGSLVAFLMGITQTDPIERGGMFERFISKDRIKPPDIDLDIEDTERPWLMRYLLAKYDAVQIGTYSLLGSSIDQETGEEKGSVLQSWLTSKRRECEDVAVKRIEAGKLEKSRLKQYAQAVFNKRYGHIREIDDVRSVSERDYIGLRQLINMKSVYRSYGVHAAGVLLPGADLAIEDYIPTMLVASSDTRVTQYDMDDVEEFGLLKMDILGQVSLRMMKRTQQNMIEVGELDPDHDPTDFTWIPDDDPEACKWLRCGRMHTGIFHYEGYTKAKGGKELGIKSTEDAIMGQALYMPGAMDSGEKDKYIARRRNPKLRKNITYISDEFRKPLEWTYGTVIFQEQVIDIMRNLGMDIEGINKFFKIVKDSGRGSGDRNAQRLAEVRAQFEELCRLRGIADVDAAWQQTAGFVSYGFNRAHASGYGIRSYRTAYYKAHYPTEFHAGLLESHAGTKKEAKYIHEARRVGIRLLPPDVNISNVSWTQDFQRSNVIRKGLVSIPGVGLKTAEAISSQKPFASMEDLIAKVPAKQMSGGKFYLAEGKFMGTLGALNDVGALDSLLGGS